MPKTYRVRDLHDLDGVKPEVGTDRLNAVIHLDGPGRYSLDENGEFVKGVFPTYCRLLLDFFQITDDDGYIRSRLGLVDSLPSGKYL